MCQATIVKISIVHSESSCIVLIPLSCDLDSLLGFLRGSVPLFSQDYEVYWRFSDHAYQHCADLDLSIQCSHKIVIIHNISMSMRQLCWQTLVPLPLWQEYWSDLDDQAFESLFLNIHLLMDPKEVLQQWDESLECLHSHILQYLGYTHQNNWSHCINVAELLMMGCIKAVNKFYSMSNHTGTLSWKLGELVCTSFRWHCMGQSKWFSRLLIQIAWFIIQINFWLIAYCGINCLGAPVAISWIITVDIDWSIMVMDN